MVINPRSLAKIYNQVKGTKCYYDILIQNGKSPNCCSKWEIKLGEGIDWKACFKKTKKIQEVKLKWFQIRLLHRVLATNIVLKEMGIAQDVLCSFCNLEGDIIQHCMWRCQHVKLFWNKLEGFLCDHCNNVQNLEFTEKIILFGTDDHFKSDSVLDFIILYAKYFIYCCRYEKIKPQLCAFKKELKKDTKLKHAIKS